MVRTCWDVLEIPVNSPERDITKAYRSKALKTHPDKVDAEDREHAAELFHQLHMAYKEALEIREDETAYPNTRGKKKRAEKRKTEDHFHNVHECFDSVCKELKRDAEEQSRKFKQDALDQIVNAWPDDPETSWTHFSFWQYQWFRNEFLALFRTTKPDLAKYLSKRWEDAEVEKAKTAAREAEKAAADAAAKIKSEWSPAKDDYFKRWLVGHVAPELEDAVERKLPRRFKKRFKRWQAHKRKEEEKLFGARQSTGTQQNHQDFLDQQDARAQASADAIVAAYPDRAKIKEILRFTQFDWPHILAKLPKKMQKLLEGLMGGAKRVKADATRSLMSGKEVINLS